MKKSFIALSLVFVFALTACETPKTPAVPETTPVRTTQAATEETVQTERDLRHISISNGMSLNSEYSGYFYSNRIRKNSDGHFTAGISFEINETNNKNKKYWYILDEFDIFVQKETELLLKLAEENGVVFYRVSISLVDENDKPLLSWYTGEYYGGDFVTGNISDWRNPGEGETFEISYDISIDKIGEILYPEREEE